MKRGTTPLARAGRLKPRSDKQRALYEMPDGRRELVARLLAERPWCEAGARSGYTGCTGVARDVHEILPRSAGGSIVDVPNLLCVCRPCHHHIHNHPRESIALGLLRSRYGGEETAE